MESAVYLKGEDTDIEATSVQDNGIEVYSPALGGHRGPYPSFGGLWEVSLGRLCRICSYNSAKQWSETEKLYWRSYFRPREQRM